MKVKIELIKEVAHDGVWYYVKVNGINEKTTNNYNVAKEIYDKIVAFYSERTEPEKEVLESFEA